MKTPVIGSRSLTNLDISQYIPADTTMIILGGAKGIDSLAETYAYRNFIPVRIFFLIMSIMAKKRRLSGTGKLSEPVTVSSLSGMGNQEGHKIPFIVHVLRVKSSISIT